MCHHVLSIEIVLLHEDDIMNGINMLQVKNIFSYKIKRDINFM